MKEGLGSYETSVLTRLTQRNVPEDAILQVKLTFIIYKIGPAFKYRNTHVTA
jgi:hypothetical protein